MLKGMLSLFCHRRRAGGASVCAHGGCFSAKLHCFIEPMVSRGLLKRYSIKNDGEVIDFEIVHRPAVTRRIHLELGEHGQLHVVAPRRMSKRAIQTALQYRARHVARFLVDARARQQDLPQLRYVSGEKHLFMGRRFPLIIHETPGQRGHVELVDGQIGVFAPHTGSEGIRVRLVNWYRQQALRQFTDRLATFSRRAPWSGENPPVMRLRNMKRTWGSCSSKGVITLNPHLVKAPEECIDYVIAHEICHLREHNHGKAFYALQEQLYPGWNEARNHLRNKGHIYLV